jgi:hypothetical protein
LHVREAPKEERIEAALAQYADRLTAIVRHIRTRPPRLYISGLPNSQAPLEIIDTAPHVTVDEFPTSQQVWNAFKRLYDAEQALRQAERDLSPDQRRMLGLG